ncbi:MAG: LamG domain-containing protein [Myxococcota bacterium]
MSGPASIAEGATASYRVTLASEPRGDVAVALALGGAHPEQLEPVAPLVAQLTRANWQSGVTLELRARQDDWKDGDLAATVAASASCASGGGCGYAGLASSALTVTNVDDEGAATLTLQVVGSPTRPTEAAGADHCVTVSVSASSRPFDGLAGDGTIVVDLAAAPTGATAVVTLDGAHWSGAGPGGSATFCAADDDIDNDSGGQPQDGLVTIVSATSSRGTDPAYGGIAATPLALTAIDDDVRGIVITGPTSLYEGASAEVVVRLASQPTGPVNVTVAGGSGDPTVLAFTPSTWRTPQPATIAAPDEDDDEHPEGAFATTVATATASGGDYTGTQAQHALDILEAGVCGTGVQIGLEECDGPDAGALASYACSELDAGNGTIACAACRWDTTPCWRARDLAVGARHACTLDTTGQLRCSVDAPDVSGLGALIGTYATLSSRAYGLTLDRTGFDADSPLASGAYFTCGFTSGAPTCIGALDRDSDGVAELAPGGIAWSATELIGAGPRHACALVADGSVSCWGDAKGFAPADWPTWTPSGVNVTALAAGLERSCACVDGSVECWGDLDYDRDGHQDATPATSCTALAAGDDFACALRADATITCWGAYPTPIPSGAYARIAAFGGHVCAAQASANANPGQVDCWGSVASAYPASTEGLVERLGFDDHAGATAETYYASGTCDASLHDQARFDDVTATSGSGSLELDGAGDYADFASCSDLIAGWHEATVELWFRADSLPSVVGTRMALVSLTDSNLLINDVFALDLVRFPDGVHLHGLARNGGSVAEPTSPVGLVAAGTWYHLALVVSDSGDSASLYLDGNLVATGAWLPTTIGQTTRHVRIGTAGEPAANWFDGHIDELRIHQRALSPTEIGQGRALQR